MDVKEGRAVGVVGWGAIERRHVSHIAVKIKEIERNSVMPRFKKKKEWNVEYFTQADRIQGIFVF